jgi:hypothetical protein
VPTNDRGGLKAAFAGFKKSVDEEAELRLLGRTVGEPTEVEVAMQAPATGPTETPAPLKSDAVGSYHIATSPLPDAPPHLVPRPLLQREAVRQLSFRCPV